MVKLVAARSSYVLAPRRDDQAQEYDPTVPYHGEIFVERRTEIEYGVTQAVSIEAIEEFLELNAPSLRSRGFDIRLRMKQK